MPTNKEKSKEVVKAICDAYDQSECCNEVKNDIKESSDHGELKSTSFTANQKSAYKSNSFTQLRWLVWRSFISSARNPMDTKINFIQTIMIAILFGLIYLQLKLTQEGVQNINGVLFLLITNTSFSNMFGVLNSFPAELPIFYREHQNSMYRVINYYLSKLLSEVFLTFIFFEENRIMRS